MYPAQECRRSRLPAHQSLASRALRLERLESRLALSHGPMSYDGDPLAACGPQELGFASPGYQPEAAGFHQFEYHGHDFGPRSGPEFGGGPRPCIPRRVTALPLDF